MEPVGSAYRLPLISDLAAGKSAEELRQAPADSAGAKIGNTRTKGITGSTPEQLGFQHSDRPVGEFRPYTRFNTQKNQKPGNDKTFQNDSTSTTGTKEKQDPQVQAQIAQLKSIEEKVKAHEAAHKSAGGAMTGAVSYSYTQGPDGRNYITGGEVPISVSPGKTPQETISRMQQVIQAALAPADPSPQDRAVAAQAAAQQLEAQQSQATAGAQATSETTSAVSSEPQIQADSIVARDSQRAYGNPAVAGKQPETVVNADPGQQEQRSAASQVTNVIKSTFATMTPAGITGYGASQPVSYYA
jgi:hypothetical protein